MTKSDAERYNSTAMNAQSNVEATSGQEGGVRIVFIGNSITLHEKAPHIGWNNEWGMAASALEKDYVHLVTAEIERRIGRKAEIRVRNLAEFERYFDKYDMSKNQDLVDFQPDYLIFALGENVAELASDEERFAYRDAFKKLLGSFVNGPHKPNTVVRGCFWPNEWKDAMMSQAADDCAVKFVKANFGDDPSMRATGLFEHTGVQMHPGDKGMEEIARRIIECLFPEDA